MSDTTKSNREAIILRCLKGGRGVVFPKPKTENENTENRNRKIILSPKIETKTEKNRKFQKYALKTQK